MNQHDLFGVSLINYFLFIEDTIRISFSVVMKTDF